MLSLKRADAFDQPGHRDAGQWLEEALPGKRGPIQLAKGEHRLGHGSHQPSGGTAATMGQLIKACG